MNAKSAIRLQLLSSMRGQMILTLLAGILLLFGIAAGGIYFYVNHVLTRQFDAALIARAEAVSACVHLDRDQFTFSKSDPVVQDFVPRPHQRPSYFEIWYPTGGVYARSDSLTTGDLPPKTPQNGPICGDMTLPNGHEGRAVSMHVDPQAADADDLPAGPHTLGGLWITVAESRHSLDDPMQELLGGLGIAAGVAAIAIVFMVTIVIRRGMRPLARVADTASQIDATSLKYRFDLSDMPAELSPICVRLNDLLARLDGAFERERRFTSDVAHELRTPIAELRTLAEVSLRWPPERPAAAMGDALAIARHMERMVTTLLALARCESGRQVAQISDTDLVPLITDAWRPLQSEAARRNLNVQFDLPAEAMIRTDPDCLASIITNLLSNAVQYSTPDATITCRVKTDSTGSFELAVSNPTDGLSLNDLPHIAEPFWRKSEARSPDDHSGLGLALVKAYAAVLQLKLDFSLTNQNIFTATVQLPAPTQTPAAPAVVGS